MNKKQILLILIVITACLFIGNWVYGNVLANKIQEQLEQQLELAIGDVDVEFEKVVINPLFSKVELIGLEIRTINGQELLLGSSQVKLAMPYSEAMRLLKTDDFEHIKSFNVQLFDLSLNVIGADDNLLVDDLSIQFRGHISKQDIEVLNTQFPDKKQAVKIKAKHLRFANTPWMDALGFTKEQIQRFNKVDNLFMDLEFDPKKNRIVLDDLHMHSPIVSYVSKGQMTYDGEGLDNFSIKQAASSLELKLNDKGLQWGNKESNGLYSLDNLYVKMDGVMNHKGAEPVIQSHTTKFLVENLTVEYAGEKKQQMEQQAALLGLKMDKLMLQRLALNSELKNNELYITDTEIKSSLLDAQLKAKINVNALQHELSQIEKGTLVISNLAPGLKNALSTFELMTMQSLPRKGNSIVLEMSGNITRPNIKGLRY
ncbi:hypothetical protein [Carboxylicivirga marina]|uniref:AsmA-like C-terminal domain-containing protein n=1 Tax=Carboxylicivirga marina TaxID=2800988 RepID=A0ABS1HQ57_9BACT|nr:hypothetical protein [Carboxylicivirga marina]MBK3519807.1 hypothetical protein [Carboxylicivirga marina]